LHFQRRLSFLSRPPSAMSFQAYKHIHCVVSKKRHESFISYSSDGSNCSYRCELCDVTVGNDDAMDIHCSEREHDKRRKLVYNIQSNTVAFQCAQLQHRIDKLSVRSWQLVVQSQLYHILLTQSKHNSKRKRQIRTAEAALLKYERRESIAPLELAAWKTVCLVSDDDQMTKHKGYLSWTVWSTVGWKENKGALKDANAVGIISKAVLPFLPCDDRMVPALYGPCVHSARYTPTADSDSHESDFDDTVTRHTT
jgi:hypothetical protein